MLLFKLFNLTKINFIGMTNLVFFFFFFKHGTADTRKFIKYNKVTSINIY